MLSTLSTLVILGPDGNTRHSNVAEAVKHYGGLAYPFTPEKLWRYYGKNFFYPLKLLNIFYVDLNKTFKLLTIFDVDTLAAQNLITKTQQTFDQALFALPVTQHGMIWESYLVFVSQETVPVDTSLSVYRMYEDYIELLLMSGRGL
ncbi:hypothetical protein Bca4012_030633 [Brassica carinata]|uniref:Pre-mRNA-splicing factor Syf1-like N-terminal HAT-repeats domain-containing protein n=2 Tax=Brassica TaxID=3705 RepID=A0A3P6BSP8_BRAOL|nr:unnamed protein product [Brassica napus]VDD08763.1 unnamed protein product [Brassica oleracea]